MINIHNNVLNSTQIDDLLTYFNIEDEGRTKEELRDILERKVKLLGRKKEILNGELI